MSQPLDIIINTRDDCLLVEFVSENATAWAEAFLNSSARWEGSKLILDKKYNDHLIYALIENDLIYKENKK